MSLVLQQTLRGLCHNTPWSYAVFWKLKERARIVLTWEDGFYDYAKRNQGPAGEGDDVDTELLGLAVAKMSYHVYSYGEGIIGKIAFSGRHQWVFMGASVNTDEKHPVGWENQFMAGIKTIAVIAVPQGVVQLGSTRVVQEDLALVHHVRGLFTTLRSIPGAFLSDLMAEGPVGAQFNLAAFQTPQWAPPARPQTRPAPQPSLSQLPTQESPVAPTLAPNPGQFYARPAPVPAQSPVGGPRGRPPYAPIAPRGAWVQQPNAQLGPGFYTQVTPQLVAEGSPYGVPHPYGVPIVAPVYSNPPTPSEGGGSQGGFSMGGGTKSQRRGRRVGGETASSGGGGRGGGEQAVSEARSSDSMQPRIQRQSSTNRKESPFQGGLELRASEAEGGGLPPLTLPNPQLEFARRLSPPLEMATSSGLTGGGLMQPRPSTSYLRHSVGSLPDRYQTLLMGPHGVGGQPSPPPGRLSLLAPNPIQVHQARGDWVPQPMLEKGGIFRPHLSKGHVLEKEASPKGDTGCSTVSNAQPDLHRPPLDTQSEGASTVGDSHFPAVMKLPESGHVQSKFSGGGSSSLSTQVSAPPPELGSRFPALGNVRVSSGFSKMISEGQKPTLESVEAYRMQQQAQLESLEKAGLKGTEVYNMWEEIMKENYRVGVALAGLNEDQDAPEIAPLSVQAPSAFPPSSVPNLDATQGGIPSLGRQRSGSLQGGPLQAVSETPLISCGATEQIQDMHLSSGSRSPEPLEVKSDRADQPEPRMPEGEPRMPEGVPLARISHPAARGGRAAGGGDLTGAETVLELAAMYSPSPFLASVNRGPHDELGAEGILRGGANGGLSRMMPTPGLSPTATDLDLPASETPSPTVDPAFQAPADAFKPRSSPPVPLFFASARAPSPSGTARAGAPLFNNETIASLPTSSVWAIALKGSGEAAARRRAGLPPPAEPAMSHQGSAATQPMSVSMHACASSDVPSTPSAVRAPSAAGGIPPSDTESPRSASPEPEAMSVMSAGAALESRGAPGEFADSPGSRLEHAVSAPAGWEAPSAFGASKRTVSKRKGDEFTDDRTDVSDASGEESERDGARGRKKGRTRAAAAAGARSPRELTSSGRPRPKDRQRIQKRLAELRGVVPNTGKLSIDGLLERTIKHLEFLRSVKSEKPVRREVDLPPLLPLLNPDEPKAAPEVPPGVSANPRKRPARSVQNPEVNAKIRPERPAGSEAGAHKPPSLKSGLSLKPSKLSLKPSEQSLKPSELSLDPPQASGLKPSPLDKPRLQHGQDEPPRAEGPVDTWLRQHVPGGGAGLGRLSSVERWLSSLHSEPVLVEVLKDPRQMLIEVRCQDESFYAELSGFLHGLGLQVNRSVLQTVANGQQWARFVVETPKPVDRLEVSVPLRRFIESKTGGLEGHLESKAGEAGGSGNQLSLLPPLDMDFGAHFPTTHWQGLEGVLEHDLNMYLDDPY